MPSNLNPPLTQIELKTLVRLLTKFQIWVQGEQPLAARIVHEVKQWAAAEIEEKI